MIAKSPPVRSKAYLAYVRTLPCAWCSKTPVEASHHVRPGHGSTSMKTCDLRAIPLCTEDHADYHRHGAIGSMDGKQTRAWAEECIVDCLRGWFLVADGRGGW